VISVELRINDDRRVAEAWFEGDGCCISQAAASMLMQEIEGKTVEEIKAYRADEMLQLFRARLTPNRQKCCLLAWRVVQSAIYSPVNSDRTADPTHGKGESI
jgi:nitrogen fixation NifU-like protein